MGSDVRRSPVAVAVLVLSMLGAACADSGGAGVDETIPPVSSTVGAAGGAVVSEGASIAVPAGALAADVELTIASAAEPASLTGVTRVGPTVEIGPGGTSFATPAVVTVSFQTTALPTDTTAADVRLYVAETPAGPFEALETTVDPTSGQVSAAVSHLSVFVPGVVAPLAPMCLDDRDCDCDALWAARPLDITGTAQLGRAIQTICHDETAGELTVLSHTWRPDGTGLQEPDEYFLAKLDAVTLALRSEDPTDATVLEPAGATCTSGYREPSYLAGEDTARDIRWSAEIVEVPGEGWHEAILTLSGPTGTARYSFNRPLNEAPPYTDTNPLLQEWLLDARNSLVGRISPDGAGRFYFYAWYELHVDVLYLGDVAGALGQAAATADEHGFQTPTARKRWELRDGAATSGYGFDPLHVTADPDDPASDVLVVFAQTNPPVQGFRVSSGTAGVTLEALPELLLDDIYGQFGWQNAGPGPGGLLHIQSAAAQFDAGLLHTIDPAAFAVVDTWEIGCIGAPTVDGFQLLPGGNGQLLRFAQPAPGAADRKTARVEIIRSGVVQAVGEVPVNNTPGLWLLTGGETARLYVADEYTGALTAVALPR